MQANSSSFLTMVVPVLVVGLIVGGVAVFVARLLDERPGGHDDRRARMASKVTRDESTGAGVQWHYIQPVSRSSGSFPWVLVLYLVPIVAGGVGALAYAIHDEIASTRTHRYLERHGVPGQGVIVDTTTTEGGGESSSKSYEVTMYVVACGCNVTKPIDTLVGHDVGSVILIRYDPERPRILELGVNRPLPDVIWLTVFFAGVAAAPAVYYLFPVWRQRRDNKRARATGMKRRVVVQLWRRNYLRSSYPYLVVYDADDAILAHSLLLVPVSEGTLHNISPLALPGETLDLWGYPDPGSIVTLRRDDRDVVPASRSRPGTWEAELRGRT